MKKFSLIITAFAVVLGLSQCKKPNINPNGNNPGYNGGGQYITFTANPGGDAKLNVQENTNGLETTWEGGDKLHVYSCPNKDFSSGVVYNGSITLEDGEGKTEGKFGGDLTTAIATNYYVRVYYFGSDVAVSNGSCSVSLAAQTGTIDWIKTHMVARSTSLNYDATGNYKAWLTIPFSIVKLDMTLFTGKPNVYIDQCGALIGENSTTTYSTFKIQTTGPIEEKEEGENDGCMVEDITLDFTASPDYANVYVALLPPTATTYPGVINVEVAGNALTTDNKILVLRFSDATDPDLETKHVSHAFELIENHFYTSGVANGKTTDKGIEIIDYVDFGEAGKWAKYNVGARQANNYGNDDCKYSWYGDYYAWADTRLYYSKTDAQSSDPCWEEWVENGYSGKSYKWSDDGSVLVYTKYILVGETSYYNEGNFVVGGHTTVMQDEDDIAQILSGNYWETPTSSQWSKLTGGGCSSGGSFDSDIAHVEKTDDYYCIGIPGYIVYKKKSSGPYSVTKDPHIFLPFAGYREKTTLEGLNTNGCYASKDRSESIDKTLVTDCYDNGEFHPCDPASSFYRFYGTSVRPVVKTTKE